MTSADISITSLAISTRRLFADAGWDVEDEERRRLGVGDLHVAYEITGVDATAGLAVETSMDLLSGDAAFLTDFTNDLSSSFAAEGATIPSGFGITGARAFNTPVPTASPTATPTDSPTDSPTDAPTAAPTNPTDAPTDAPTGEIPGSSDASSYHVSFRAHDSTSSHAQPTYSHAQPKPQPEPIQPFEPNCFERSHVSHW
jgi:hypothetical protein